MSTTVRITTGATATVEVNDNVNVIVGVCEQGLNLGFRQVQIADGDSSVSTTLGFSTIDETANLHGAKGGIYLYLDFASVLSFINFGFYENISDGFFIFLIPQNSDVILSDCILNGQDIDGGIHLSGYGNNVTVTVDGFAILKWSESEMRFNLITVASTLTVPVIPEV